MVVFSWVQVDGKLVCHRTVLGGVFDWSEVDALCSKLSPLLDCHDQDRFSYLLKYGGPTG
jgi:hypothetical protein